MVTTSTTVTVIEPPRRWFPLSLRELWDHRELAVFFAWRQVKVRYKQTFIGIAWAVLQPVLTMLVFTLFFGRLARLPSDGLSYPVFFLAGLVPWTFFATALSTSTTVIVEQQRVITRVYFPRLVLPISAVLASLVDLLIATAVLVPFVLLSGVELSARALLLPVVAVVPIVVALGVGILLSALNALYRDVRYALPLLVQLWLFMSPVAYSSSLVPEAWKPVYFLNPIAFAIDAFRWSLTGAGQEPALGVTAPAVAVMMVMLVVGLIYFAKRESIFVDVV